MKPARESTFVLRECKRCGYAGCCCVPLKHKESCPWRKLVLSTAPAPCAEHGQPACTVCVTCDCGGPMVVIKKGEEVAA